MTNYNDGKWYGWNGGECPVHPDSLVDYVLDRFDGDQHEVSGRLRWVHDGKGSDIIAFRVVKEHREPREFELFIRRGHGSTWDSGCSDEVIHVREVIE